MIYQRIILYLKHILGKAVLYMSVKLSGEDESIINSGTGFVGSHILFELLIDSLSLKFLLLIIYQIVKENV